MFDSGTTILLYRNMAYKRTEVIIFLIIALLVVPGTGGTTVVAIIGTIDFIDFKMTPMTQAATQDRYLYFDIQCVIVVQSIFMQVILS
jgi:hypothetical protein